MPPSPRFSPTSILAGLRADPTRRNVAVALLVLGLLMAIGFAVSRGEPATPRSPEARTSDRSVLSESLGARSLGVTVRHPRNWTAVRKNGAVRLERKDKTAALSISAPGSAKESRRLLEEGVGSVSSRYKRVKKLGTDGRRLGGLPAESTALSAVNRRGTPLRILVGVAEGRRKAYLVNLFTARDRSSARLLEAQVILNSLRLKN